MNSRDGDTSGIPGGRRAAIISSEGARYGDVAGSDVLADPRVGEQLALLRGMYLAEFSMSVGAVRLVLRSDTMEVEREVEIEQQTIGLSAAGPGQGFALHAWNEAAVATKLLASLQLRVSHVDIDRGHLSIDFEEGARFRVEPDQQYEAWQVSSRDGLLMVCQPGGGVVVWLPHAP